MNGEREKREGEIYITDGTLTETVKVYQYGGDVILLNENEYPVGDKGETIKVELRSNCEYGITMPDVSWIKEATMSRECPVTPFIIQSVPMMRMRVAAPKLFSIIKIILRLLTH